MNYRFYIGVDVSKNTLDVCLLDEKVTDAQKHIQVMNNTAGVKELLKWLHKTDEYVMSEAIFCMEHTGMYNYHALTYLTQQHANIWLESSVQIKKSGGIQRGKNDKADAFRIAQYAMRNVRQAKLWQPSREVVDQLRHLSTLRDNLVETKKKLETPVKEFKQFGNQKTAKLLEKSIAHSLKAINNDIDRIEKQIQHTIDNDDELKKLFKLITSVVGVGFVSAVNLIVHTNEFKLFKNVRQLACYCGVAPFEYTSGISIRGKTRVSHMANKKLKTNLHMGSLTAVKLDPDLKAYYERKVAEGKNKMSVLNAVRNKLLQRIFAVVSRGYSISKKLFA